MTAASNEENGSSKLVSLTPELKEILHQSILHYLHRSGFTKTFKRFQSEAQIQNDTWKSSSTNLEDIYCKYINTCRHTEDEKTTTSRKKKKKNSGESENQSKTTMENNEVVESGNKSKKKKKNKHDLVSGGEAEEVKSNTMNELEVNESKKKLRDCKKKKNNQQDQQENGDVHPDEAKEAKKSSKKRKRLSDENEHQSVEESKMEANQTVEESKSKKDEIDENEKLEIKGGEKSVKKQRNGSAEPKTVNAFQRVKIDQVEFAHEKLQDNSYWAKDGADVGYGAKAQEVLGQVRGRDFRHEKTKKKRGSYRGGQIDLQSHSIKFDYSDEE